MNTKEIFDRLQKVLTRVTLGNFTGMLSGVMLGTGWVPTMLNSTISSGIHGLLNFGIDVNPRRNTLNAERLEDLATVIAHGAPAITWLILKDLDSTRLPLGLTFGTYYTGLALGYGFMFFLTYAFSSNAIEAAETTLGAMYPEKYATKFGLFMRGDPGQEVVPVPENVVLATIV